MELLRAVDRLDRHLFLALAGQGGAAADAVWTGVSSVYGAVIFWMLLWALRRKDFEWSSWLWLLVTMLAAFAAADWTTNLVKSWAVRPRPCFALEGQYRAVAACRGAFGFFSGHSSTTWALLTVYLASRPPRVLVAAAVVWALAVPYSRIYLGVHYPSDVVVGSLAGILIARLLLQIRPLPSPR